MTVAGCAGGCTARAGGSRREPRCPAVLRRCRAQLHTRGRLLRVARLVRRRVHRRPDGRGRGPRVVDCPHSARHGNQQISGGARRVARQWSRPRGKAGGCRDAAGPTLCQGLPRRWLEAVSLGWPVTARCSGARGSVEAAVPAPGMTMLFVTTRFFTASDTGFWQCTLFPSRTLTYTHTFYT